MLSRIIRRLDFSEKARIKRLRKNPPKVEDDRILFTSSEDYSGNPKALFLYMIEHGLNERYKITWLFERRENMFDFGLPNVESLCMYNGKGERTLASNRAAMKAKYLFFSHNLNWVRVFREEQNFIDLWHGCGYKRDLKKDKTRVEYDYMIVVGKKYQEIFPEIMHNYDGKVLDLGYPRNEFFFSDHRKAIEYISELKNGSGADRTVIWMPTFRRSDVKRLDMDIEVGGTGLPIVDGPEDMRKLDEYCRHRKVLLMIKKHHLQSAYRVDTDELSNIVFISSDELKKRDIDLYELIAETDALLTDYSSVAIDHMLLDRPMGFTLDDFDQYEEARGWDLHPVKDYMPGHHIYDLDGLRAFISDIAMGIDAHRSRRNEIRDVIHTHERDFSRRIVEYFDL